MVLSVIVVALSLGADSAQTPTATGTPPAVSDHRAESDNRAPRVDPVPNDPAPSDPAALSPARRPRSRGYLSRSGRNVQESARGNRVLGASAREFVPIAPFTPGQALHGQMATPRVRPATAAPLVDPALTYQRQIASPWAEQQASPLGFAGTVETGRPSPVGPPRIQVFAPDGSGFGVQGSGPLLGTSRGSTFVPPTAISPTAPPVVPNAAADELSFANYYNPFSRQLAYGNAGAQPYHLGWYFYDEVTWMPSAAVRGVTGSFQDLQYNTWARYSRPFLNRYLFTWTPTWNTSFWTGPAGVNLPGSVDQLVSDFQIASVAPGPWNFQIGFTPQINSDFRKALNSNAYMFDGRFVLFYQASPHWRLAAGAAYWNRVHDFFIPYGGVIWSPDDRWEFRLFFPKTRISRYWGEVGGKQVWTYASIGYDVEAWQVTIQNESPYKTRMQMSANELLLGASAHRNFWTAYVEAGLIFDRHVLFRDNTPSFGINDSLVLRVGALY